MPITYRHDNVPQVDQIIELYASAALNRPIDNVDRIEKMYANSNLIITAWDGARLVGVSRALTDFCYCCYVSDLAVRGDYQHQGIGQKLLDLTRQQTGNLSNIVLLSAPEAMDYYPKVGLQKADNAFMIKREG